MSANGGQGQSAATIDKERRIAACLTVNMTVASHRFGGRGYRYWHLDANSGCGWNDDVNVPGSPMVFWEVADAYLKDMEPAPFFCDRDKKAMAGLYGRLGVRAHRSFLLPGDNEEAIEVFAECIRQRERPQFAIGSLLIDPNGYFYRRPDGEGVPINAMQWFCRDFDRIDIILNLNIRAFHLQQSRAHDVIPPAELLSRLGRSYWHVGRANAGQSRFLLAIGRNFATKDHANLGLYRTDGEVGGRILDAAGRRGAWTDEIPGLSSPSRFSGRSNGSAAEGWRPVRVRGEGDGGASPALPAVGDVRCAIEPKADLSHLPLFGARER